MLRLYTTGPAPRAEPVERALLSSLLQPGAWGRDVVSRETASLMDPVVQQEDGSFKMELYLDLHKFKPSEVKVETKEGMVTVEANSERKSEDGSFVSTSGVRRTFPIPEGVKKEEMTAKFTEDGGLLLEAPCVPPKPKDAPAAVKGDTPLGIKHH